MTALSKALAPEVAVLLLNNSESPSLYHESPMSPPDSPPRSPQNFYSFNAIDHNCPTITLLLTSLVTPVRPHPHSKKTL